jgi:hypothetical protein
VAREKPNINDAARLRDVRRALGNRGVSATAISTVEAAVRRGMVFEDADDLRILDIPAEDATAAAAVVTFGPASAAGSGVKRVQYRFEPDGDETKFFGYQFIVRYVTNDDFVLEESYPIEVDRTVVVDYDLSVIKGDSVVGLRVNTATGSRASIRPHSGNAKPSELIEVPVGSLANAVIDVTVEALDLPENPPTRASYAVKGKVISLQGIAKLDGLQVVIFAATKVANNVPDYVAVATATTETNGYFVTAPLLFDDPSDSNRVRAAKGSVGGEGIHAEVPIRLESTPETATLPGTSRIPEHVILVIDGDQSAGEHDADCGCNDLNFHEKKVLEEHSYYTVVRTSEPSIIADVLEDEREVDLEDIYGVPIRVPISVFRKYYEIERRQATPLSASSPAESGLVTLAMRSDTATERTTPNPGLLEGRSIPFNQGLLNRLITDHKAGEVIKGDTKPVFRGRTYLTQTKQIDWDDEPTIYQAASIAHGHLLHFKQEWLPDGYSIGDLVYSLPLAPGQKKQIAVLDWERRESAANSQSLDYEETLNNSLVRDRDVSDVISGTLTENIRGNSRASTGGIGFGLGSSVMGIIPGVGTFGGLLGISGGGGVAKSSATQSATRDMTASSLQQITDRTEQATSVVRSQRATVVQTVSQGERVQATAESVANYNHCHAITIQYFEVLRHFAVRNRLAGVQECLFVPLQMTPFDFEKIMRWRNSLEKHLFRRDLRRAFDAVTRIQNERESAQENYYDSIGFPRKYYAEEVIESFSGELQLEFFFFNTNAQKLDDDIIKFFNFFGISLDAYRDKQITDEQLAQAVGPRTIEFLLDAFALRTDKGADLRLDLTLLSSFRQNAPLRVSVRQSASTPRSIARDQIDATILNLDLGRLSPEVASSVTQFGNKYMKIRLRSGNLRYRTKNLSGTLFDGRIENDIFAGGDGAYMSAPLSTQELRNPRGEDIELANNLLHHLNENLEYYNKALFFDFSPERRFMLLDGIIAPGKANGRSVASVVENRVIGVAGNSLIMPVAPGNQLDPTIDENFDLFAQYYTDLPDPLRVSIPTRGVYAEAVMGTCNSCEQKDETRFWRWEESPIPDSPNTQILPISTDTRRAEPGDLQAKDFPAPMVNIQNAPELPEPVGLQGLLETLGKSDAFRDVTGLTQNQLNAIAAYQKAMDTAKEFGSEAAELAKSMANIQAAMDARRQGAISNEDAQKVIKQELGPKDPEKERAEAKADLKTIDEAKEKEQINQDQQEEMSEDRLRKQQGTTKPKPTTPKKPSKRKYHLTLVIKNDKGAQFDGTWVLNFGSLRDEGFETTVAAGEKQFDVELVPGVHTTFRLLGNPWLSGASFPETSEFYYHTVMKPAVGGANPNLYIEVGQTHTVRTVNTSQAVTEQEAKAEAVARESNTQREYTAGSGTIPKLLVSASGKVTFFGKKTDTRTTTTTTGETVVTGETWEVELLSSTLSFYQAGQPYTELKTRDE